MQHVQVVSDTVSLLTCPAPRSTVGLSGQVVPTSRRNGVETGAAGWTEERHGRGAGGGGEGQGVGVWAWRGGRGVGTSE